jgi:hypothetical protein
MLRIDITIYFGLRPEILKANGIQAFASPSAVDVAPVRARFSVGSIAISTSVMIDALIVSMI